MVDKWLPSETQLSVSGKPMSTSGKPNGEVWSNGWQIKLMFDQFPTIDRQVVRRTIDKW
jgi:hypothetical protein